MASDPSPVYIDGVFTGETVHNTSYYYINSDGIATSSSGSNFWTYSRSDTFQGFSLSSGSTTVDTGLAVGNNGMFGDIFDLYSNPRVDLYSVAGSSGGSGYQDEICNIMGCLPMGASLEPSEISSSPALITFTVDQLYSSTGHSTYQAEEGMTWGEWVESEYNTDGFYGSSGIYIGPTGNSFTIYYDSGITAVVSTDVIVSNHIYYKVRGGAGN